MFWAQVKKKSKSRKAKQKNSIVKFDLKYFLIKFLSFLFHNDFVELK